MLPNVTPSYDNIVTNSLTEGTLQNAPLTFLLAVNHPHLSVLIFVELCRPILRRKVPIVFVDNSSVLDVVCASLHRLAFGHYFGCIIILNLLSIWPELKFALLGLGICKANNAAPIILELLQVVNAFIPQHLSPLCILPPSSSSQHRLIEDLTVRLCLSKDHNTLSRHSIIA